jgi:hypothetical protein
MAMHGNILRLFMPDFTPIHGRCPPQAVLGPAFHAGLTGQQISYILFPLEVHLWTFSLDWLEPFFSREKTCRAIITAKSISI